MAWTQLQIVQGVSQWIDPTRADGWIANVQFRCSPAVMARVALASWSDQAQWVLDTWTALGYAFQSVNLPPIACRYYAQPWLDFLAENRRRATEAVKPHVALDANHLLCYVVPRLGLDLDRATVKAECANQTAAECGASWRCARYLPDGSGTRAMATNVAGIPVQPGVQIPLENCDPYDWTVLGYSGGQPDFGAAGPVCGVSKVVPPLVWFTNLPRDIASVWQRAGTVAMVKDSVAYAILVDLDQANRLGTTPEEVQRLTRNLPNQLDALHRPDPTETAAVGATGTLIAGLAAAGAGASATGPFGIALAAIVAAVIAALEIVGIAVGELEDPWGRPIPDERMSRAWVQWYISPNAPPSVSVPDPPTRDALVAMIPGPPAPPQSNATGKGDTGKGPSKSGSSGAPVRIPFGVWPSRFNRTAEKPQPVQQTVAYQPSGPIPPPPSFGAQPAAATASATPFYKTPAGVATIGAGSLAAALGIVALIVK